LLKNEGPTAFWRAINGNFLLALFSGILLSIASFASLVSHLLESQPILVWSFFFGLIVASIVYIFRQLPRLRWPEWTFLWVGTLMALGVSLAPPIQGSSDWLMVFMAGTIAICAMILPGVSGSFILLLLGMYPIMIDAISGFHWQIILVFMLGCVTGLMAFTRFLSWLLRHYHSCTIALLTGFLLGSLYVVWPWRETLEVLIDSRGRETILSSRLLLPAEFARVTGLDPKTFMATLCMVAGLLLVLGLEYLGGQQRKKL
jgi:putative membrane protein